MLKGEDIIIFSSIDWDFIWQTHQEIASRLAKNGNRVLFVENTGARTPTIRDIPRIKERISHWIHSTKGIRKEADNLFVYSPLVFPFPYSRVFSRLNKYIMMSVIDRWIKSLDFKEPVVWVFLPNGITLNLIKFIPNKAIVYHCVDNFEKSSRGARKIRRTEKALLKKSDLVFTTSHRLYDFCKSYNENVHLFPSGADIERFQDALQHNYGMPDDLRNIKPPIIGYTGGVYKWIDQKLIKDVAENNKDFSFVFLGPVQTDISLLKGLRNVYFLGQKSRYESPIYMKFFDVCAMPYLITDYTKCVYPAKLNEYLALGKPVVSTNLPEIEIFNRDHDNILKIADNAEDFSACIRKSLGDNKEAASKRMEVASQNSWAIKVESMNDLIQGKIEAKMRDRQKRWKELFLHVYNRTKRNIIKFALAIALLYTVFFHTPSIWFLGKPLIISEHPVKADVIVVLGGGMGESGRPEQGHEERVEFAVNLYKAGFAPYIIFSSGYAQVFKEAEIMKILAGSLGVPGDVIFLEKESASTHQAVKYIKEIMLENNWKSMNIISSPYHMRRLYLVLKTQASDMDMRLTPVPHSAYYDRSRGIKMRHIRGIIHEYLGILYYWWKGYIK